MHSNKRIQQNPKRRHKKLTVSLRITIYKINKLNGTKGINCCNKKILSKNNS